MAARKARIPVIVDTNSFVRNFKARGKKNPNRRVIRLWLLENRLQLIVSPEIIEEYLGVFAGVLGMVPEQIEEWRKRFEEDRRCTVISLGPRSTACRDPDDNVFLTTAQAGGAAFLITNDRDLLEVPAAFRRRLPFAILTPEAFLAASAGAD